MKSEGWAWPTATARKAHYFRETRSLCGKYAYWAAEFDGDASAKSPDDCAACRRKLEASNASA